MNHVLLVIIFFAPGADPNAATDDVWIIPTHFTRETCMDTARGLATTLTGTKGITWSNQAREVKASGPRGSVRITCS